MQKLAVDNQDKYVYACIFVFFKKKKGICGAEWISVGKTVREGEIIASYLVCFGLLFKVDKCLVIEIDQVDGFCYIVTDKFIITCI